MPDKPGQPERREHPREPIRLKVNYESASALITEYTTSVSKGGCQLRSQRGLPVGSRFIFELFAKDSDQPVQIQGEVVRSEKSEDGMYEIGIRYTPTESAERARLDQLIQEIFDDQKFEKARRHPRIPVNLIAKDGSDPSRAYLVRDLSRGGMGLRLPNDASMPPGMKVGRKLRLAVELEGESSVDIRGEVVWVVEGRSGLSHGRIGVSFPVVGNRQIAALEALTRLKRPAKLTITFATPEDPAR